MMSKKKFKIPKARIRTLVHGKGSCIASDKITVDGFPIRYMYREEPNFDTDSGWRFFSGTEEQDYVDNPDNLAIYDINTLANYDPSIIPFLDSEIGTEFEKDSTNEFVLI
jgi:hypothetical protein